MDTNFTVRSSRNSQNLLNQFVLNNLQKKKERESINSIVENSHHSPFQYLYPENQPYECHHQLKINRMLSLMDMIKR